MSSCTYEELAEWADKKRVSGHLTSGRADRDKCTCAGSNCLMAQAAADHFRALAANSG